MFCLYRVDTSYKQTCAVFASCVWLRSLSLILAHPCGSEYYYFIPIINGWHFIICKCHTSYTSFKSSQHSRPWEWGRISKKKGANPTLLAEGFKSFLCDGELSLSFQPWPSRIPRALDWHSGRKTGAYEENIMIVKESRYSEFRVIYLQF